MRIVFVNAWNRALSWFYYAQGMSSPPYGACRVAAKLTDRGHDVTVLDGQMLREDAPTLASRVADLDPDLVLVGAFPELHLHVFMGAAAYPYDLELSHGIREVLPTVKILLGGYMPRRFPDLAAEDARSVDGLVPDEAAMDSHLAPSPVNGPRFRRADGLSCLVPGIESYGIARSLYLDDPGSEVFPVLPILTATGCPHRCVFCATPAHFKGRYVSRPIDAVLDEVEHGVVTHGIHDWSIWDDTFTVRADRVEAICRGLIDRSLEIRWWCFGHAAWVVQHADLLPLLHEAGCRMMWIGVESLEESNLARYSKGLAADTALRAVDRLVAADMLPTTSFLLGEPDDDATSLDRRLRATEKFTDRGCVNVFTLLIPVPGTPLFQALLAEDRLASTDLRLYSGVRSVVRYPGIDPSDVEKLFFEAYTGSILSKRWVSTTGRANLFTSQTGDGPNLDVGLLRKRAREELGRLQRLERGPGAEVDACRFA